jgi:acetyl-CoA carboxylase biotin carboxyl carrier protein
MDLGYVKKLVKLLSESTLSELEVEEEGKKIRLVKHINNSVGGTHPAAVSVPVSVPASPAVTVPVAAPTPGPAVVIDSRLHEIKSPIVGTFYKAPAPDAAPFVEVGSQVQAGTVLCIVEAMKLMNEIESDVAGKIVKILVENGQPVEYDQPLFLLEKA